MKKGGSKGSGNGKSASKAVATAAYVSSVPVKTTVTFKGAKGGGGGVGSYQNKSQVSYGDKKSGCYGKATAKEKVSAGEFKWKNGTSGSKSEYKKSSTVRVGDKSGYTEVHSEQTVRNVSYNNNNNNNKSSKKFISDGGYEYVGSYDVYRNASEY